MKEKKCHEKRVFPDCYMPREWNDRRCVWCKPTHCYMINAFYFFLSCLDLTFRVAIWVGFPAYVIFLLYTAFLMVINLWK